MTEIRFHFGVADKMAYVCRLLRQASVAGTTVMVAAPEPLHPVMSAQIWASSPTAFVAHACASDAASLRRYAPILLAASLDAVPAGYTVLINLFDHLVQGFERFERVLEVVGTESQDRLAARARWKSYAHEGYAIAQHDAGKKSIA